MYSPISEKLRYLVPFRPPEETLDFFSVNLMTPTEERVLVLADDGEKFGGWPGTYRTVYEEGGAGKIFDHASGKQ